MVIKCVASMLTMHWQSLDVEVKEESPTLASVVDNNNGTRIDKKMNGQEEDSAETAKAKATQQQQELDKEEEEKKKKSRRITNSASGLKAATGKTIYWLT